MSANDATFCTTNINSHKSYIKAIVAANKAT